MRFRSFFRLLPAVLSLVAGAGPVLAKPTVLATTSLAADLVRSLGGDRVTVHALMGPGTDPHLYKATPRDVARLRAADALIHHGLHLEGRLSDVLVALGRQGKPVFDLSTALTAEDLYSPEGARGQADPHVWMDPQLWARCATVVATALTQLDPEGAAHYASALASLQAEYIALAAWAQQEVNTLAPAQRVLITSHDAYSYFGRAFGVEVIGVQGMSTVTEAGLSEVARIGRLIRERGIKAIFVETSVSPATIRRLSQDTGASIGGELFSDALGASGEIRRDSLGDDHDVGTYVGMIRHNVRTFVTALR